MDNNATRIDYLLEEDLEKYESETAEALNLQVEEQNVGDLLKLKSYYLQGKAAQSLGKSQGRYLSLTLTKPITEALSPQETDNLVDNIARQLARLCKETARNVSSVLIVGIGNPQLLADSLGGCVCDSITVGKGVFKYKPLTVAQTGVESMAIIKSLVENIKPSLVIAVDTLAARSYSRMGQVVQLTNGGIRPGSGCDNAQRELSAYSLSCPFIAIGVPMVISVNAAIVGALIGEERDGSASNYGLELVMNARADLITKKLGELIADSIEKWYYTYK